jgi:hypothetical protein
MNKALAQAILNVLIYLVAYMNDISMIWKEDKAEKLLDAVRDEVQRMK